MSVGVAVVDGGSGEGRGWFHRRGLRRRGEWVGPVDDVGGCGMCGRGLGMERVAGGGGVGVGVGVAVEAGVVVEKVVEEVVVGCCCWLCRGWSIRVRLDARRSHE